MSLTCARLVALGSKDFLYKQRVWYLKESNGVCSRCSTGCSIFVDSNKDIVYRLRPRTNPEAQGYFMCDEGRYGYHFANSAERIRSAARPHGERGSGPAPWSAVTPQLRQAFADAAQANAPGIVAVLSPFLTLEEAFLLATLLQGPLAGRAARARPGPGGGRGRPVSEGREGQPHRADDVHRSAPRSVRIAAASRRCSNTSRGR